MGATAVTRPVGVDELRRAYHAVLAGEFRATPGGARRRPPAPLPATGITGTSWVPAAGETVIPVLGSASSCGATTVALALATAAGEPARLVECAPASDTGLAAASTAELGRNEHGWLRGTRDEVLLERPHAVSRATDVPPPSPADEARVTILDTRHHPDPGSGPGWLPGVLAEAPAVVVVARSTVPGVRRLEASLTTFDPARVVAAVGGPPVKRWPREVVHSLGHLTRQLLDDGRLVEIPEDRTLAVRGLTPAPLPAPLIAAATRGWRLLEGMTDHAR